MSRGLLPLTSWGEGLGLVVERDPKCFIFFICTWWLWIWSHIPRALCATEVSGLVGMFFWVVGCFILNLGLCFFPSPLFSRTLTFLSVCWFTLPSWWDLLSLTELYFSDKLSLHLRWFFNLSPLNPFPLLDALLLNVMACSYSLAEEGSFSPGLWHHPWVLRLTYIHFHLCVIVSYFWLLT